MFAGQNINPFNLPKETLEAVRANPLQKLKAKAKEMAVRALGGLNAIKYNSETVKSFSKDGDRQCNCYKSRTEGSCYKLIDQHTVRFYRELLWSTEDFMRGGEMNDFEKTNLKKMGWYERNKLVYKFVEEDAKREKSWMAANRKVITPSNLRISLHLQDLNSGRLIQVCETAFAGVLGVGKDKVGTIKKMVKEGRQFVRDKEVEKAMRTKEKGPLYQAVVTFLEGLTEDLANHSPDCRVTELPSGFKANFYEMFVEAWKEGLLTGEYYRGEKHMAEGNFKPPSKALFYRVWRNEFPDLKVPKRHNRFSKCDWCTTLKAHLETARHSGDREEVKYWKACLYEHYSWVTLQRRKYHKHRRKAAENPEK